MIEVIDKCRKIVVVLNFFFTVLSRSANLPHPEDGVPMNDIDERFAEQATIGSPPPFNVVAQSRAFRRTLRAKFWQVGVATALVVSLSIAVYPIIPRTYRSSAMVLLQPTDQAGQPIIGRSTMNALDENEIAAYDDILSSRPMLVTVIEKLDLLNDPEFNPTLQTSRLDQWKQRIRSWLLIPPMPADEAVEANLRRHLFTTRAHKSYAMQVGFWSDDPGKAAAMANTLADAFVASRLVNKLQAQEHFAKELERRQAELARTVAESEVKRHAYLVKSGLVHEGERQALQHQLTMFSEQYAQATSAAHSTQDHAQNLLEMQRAGTLDSAPEVLDSPVIRNLKERLITLTSGTGTGPATGGISATPDKLNELKALINVEAQRIVRSAQVEALLARTHADVLRLLITAIDGKIVAYKEAETRLEGIQREVDADQTALKETMAQYRAQGSIMVALRSDAEIVSTAVESSRPSSPNLPLYAVGTLFMAVLVSGAVMLPTLIGAASRQQKYNHSYARA
jgi:polysaccharide biosynthesis transport protein